MILHEVEHRGRALVSGTLAATLLGRSPALIVRLASRGELHRYIYRGRTMYDRGEVERVRESRCQDCGQTIRRKRGAA